MFVLFSSCALQQEQLDVFRAHLDLLQVRVLSLNFLEWNGHKPVPLCFRQPGATFLYSYVFDAGFQEHDSTAFCTASENIVFQVTLSMSKADFIAREDRYIDSIASTAGVLRSSVNILSIEEISSGAVRAISMRVSTSSVLVKTSIMIASVQRFVFQNQSLLTAVLVKNGLPSSTITFLFPQITSLPAVSDTTAMRVSVTLAASSQTSTAVIAYGVAVINKPTPLTSTPAPDGSVPGTATAALSTVLLGAILGGASGLFAFLACACLVYWRRRITLSIQIRKGPMVSLNSRYA